MIKSPILAPFGWAYGAGMQIRNWLYEKGIFKSTDLKIPAISVGNITFGGTGKTPLVARVAEILAASGEKVCILTRGYGRENEKAQVIVSDGEKILATVGQAGDEPLELARKLLGKASVIADADRCRAAVWAREKLSPTVFVLDDAFQHLKVRRDLDIVCIDATNPFGSGKNLSAGILREPPKNLRRAAVIIITRANLTDNISALKARIVELNPAAEIFITENKLSFAFDVPPATPVAAFCGLGNPENFFAQLRQEKFNLADAQIFPDHYFYTQEDIDRIEKEARKREAIYLVTTAKDAVKLSDLKFEILLCVAESELVFDDENSFRQLILGAVRQR